MKSKNTKARRAKKRERKRKKEKKERKERKEKKEIKGKKWRNSDYEQRHNDMCSAKNVIFFPDPSFFIIILYTVE